MRHSWEFWTALGLIAAALTGLAAALASDGSSVEESCAKPAPRGEPVAMRATERTHADAEGLVRSFEFAPARTAERVVFRACGAERVVVEREAPALRVRADVVAAGERAERELDDAEVRLHAFLDGPTLRVAPSYELRGRDGVPGITFTLLVPPGVVAHVEGA